MNLRPEAKEIAILLSRYNLPKEKADFTSAILQAYFNESSDFTSTVESARLEFKLVPEKAREIIIAGAILYYPFLPSAKQDEAYRFSVEYDIDAIVLKKQLIEEESKIIFPEEGILSGTDLRRQAIEIFKTGLLGVVNSKYPTNRRMLDDSLIELLYTEGEVFQKDLEKALKTNQQAIGSQPIIIEGNKMEPTIANWYKDFAANNLLTASNALAAEYFNQSENFKNLKEQEKKSVTALLQLARNIKNFNLIFNKLNEDQWRIIPSLPNEAELEKQEKINDLKLLYQADIDYIMKKYRVEENLPAYKTKTSVELIDILSKDAKNPEIVLPIIMILNETEPDFKILLESEVIAKIKRYNNGLEFLKPADKHPLRIMLDYCELANDESAVFVSYLAGKNKNLMGLTYADLKENTFKWRE